VEKQFEIAGLHLQIPPKKEQREGNLNQPSVNQAHLHAGLKWPRPCSHHRAGQNTKARVLLSRNFGTPQSSEPFEFLKIQDNVGSWQLAVKFVEHKINVGLSSTTIEKTE
jgi:hypothetical protein